MDHDVLTGLGNCDTVLVSPKVVCNKCRTRV